MLETVTITKHLIITMIVLSFNLIKLSSKEELYKVHVLIISGASNNNAQLVKVNGYCDIAKIMNMLILFTLFDLHM